MVREKSEIGNPGWVKYVVSWLPNGRNMSTCTVFEILGGDGGLRKGKATAIPAGRVNAVQGPIPGTLPNVLIACLPQ